MNLAGAAHGLIIREPRESEFAVCRMLLPDAASDPTGRFFRLAFDSAKRSIAGALAYQDDSGSLTNVRLHVVKSRRRSGVGSFLLNYVLDEARRLGRQRVLVDTDLKKEPEAEAFLIACGFQRIGRLTSVRGPLIGRGPKAALFNHLLAKAEEFPPESRLVSIGEAPADQIFKLYSDYIANVPGLADMQGAFQLEQHRDSVVVMSGERVIGFLLAKVSGGIVHVPALAVVPEYRGRGMTNRMVRVLEDSLDKTVDEGQFDFADSATFTAKLAGEFGHHVLRIAARFERKL